MGNCSSEFNRPLKRISFMFLLVLPAIFGLQPASGQPAPGYYDDANTSASGTLRASLHEIIDDHTRYPYTSSATDTWDILEIGDEDQDDPGNVITIYRNASYPKQGGGNSMYNREHTWPKSYGFPNDGSSNYPYTDVHHLFLADSGYNSSRSNKPFDSCSASCAEKSTDSNNGRGGMGWGDSNWTGGSYTDGAWEVWTGRRGDIARAMMYMDVRYEGGVHGITGVGEPDLILTDDRALIAASNTGSNESVAYMGLLSVLLEWHDEDPVDLIEFQHNEAAASFQGNRNPFVDHPEWVDCVFRAICNDAPPDTTPPTAPTGLAWINEFHYDNGGADFGEFVEVAGEAGLDLSGWRLVAYNGNGGGAYATIELSGTLPDLDAGFGVLAWDLAGLQNGSPDGIALIDESGSVVEFLSYEGVLTAADGPAAGMTSVDVGVTETSSTPLGWSLQRSGTGLSGDDFFWAQPQPDTYGAVNTGQSF